MKNNKIFLLFIGITFLFSVAAQAQKKPSEKSLASSIAIIKQKQAARKAFIARMQQSTPAEENKPVLRPAENANAGAAHVNTTSPPTNGNGSPQAIVFPGKGTEQE